MNPNSPLLKLLLVLMAIVGALLILVPGACGLLVLELGMKASRDNLLELAAMLGLPMVVGGALLIGAWVGAKAQREAVANAREMEMWAAQQLAAHQPGAERPVDEPPGEAPQDQGPTGEPPDSVG